MECPIHKTEMYYSKTLDMHACVDVNCVTGRGVSEAVVQQLAEAVKKEIEPWHDWDAEADLVRTAPPSGRYVVTKENSKFLGVHQDGDYLRDWKIGGRQVITQLWDISRKKNVLCAVDLIVWEGFWQTGPQAVEDHWRHMRIELDELSRGVRCIPCWFDVNVDAAGMAAMRSHLQDVHGQHVSFGSQIESFLRDSSDGA
jgi:hypothetical protein